MISVSSKRADPSCSDRFDQTLPLAWQIHSRGSFVNAQASKQEHKTRCSKCTNVSDQTLINRHHSGNEGGLERWLDVDLRKGWLKPDSLPYTRDNIKHERLAQLNEINYFQFTANVIDTDVLILAESAME